jgi:hypothetical protein
MADSPGVCHASLDRRLHVLESLQMRSALVRFLVVLAALLVLPGSAWGRDHYLCHMTGRVLSTCCCATEDASEDRSGEPSVRSADCCEKLRSGDGAKAINKQASVQKIEPAALTGVVPEPLYLAPHAPVRQSVVRQGRGPPTPKRPLFAVHCAYLR